MTGAVLLNANGNAPHPSLYFTQSAQHRKMLSVHLVLGCRYLERTVNQRAFQTEGTYLFSALSDHRVFFGWIAHGKLALNK